MRPLKILLWSPKGCGNHYYGPGKNAFNLYSEIKKNEELELVLVHAYPNHEKLSLFDEVYRIGNFEDLKLIPFVKYLLKSFEILWKYRKQGFVFHGLDVYSNIYIPALIAKLLGYRVALKVAAYPSGFNASKNKLLLFSRRISIHLIDKFFAISYEIVDELKGLKVKGDKIECVYNGVEIPQNREDILKGHSGDTKTILFTGALVRRKRPHLLIKAIAKSKNPKAWIMNLVGPITDKAYFSEMEAMVEAYGLSEQINFHGFKRDLNEFYLQADLYALPSLSEGMPNGVLEAMSFSLPILISNFSSASILCNKENGFIADNVEGYSNCLDLFIENTPLFEAKGSKSFDLVKRDFSLSKVSEKYTKILNELSP